MAARLPGIRIWQSGRGRPDAPGSSARQIDESKSFSLAGDRRSACHFGNVDKGVDGEKNMDRTGSWNIMETRLAAQRKQRSFCMPLQTATQVRLAGRTYQSLSNRSHVVDRARLCLTDSNLGLTRV